MQVFTSTLETTLLLFIFILAGYVLRKGKLLPDNAGTVLSKLENYVILPAVVISSFMENCTVANITAKWSYIATGGVILLILTPISFLVARLLGRTPSDTAAFRYSTAIANFGFYGIPIVSNVFGPEALFDYLVFTLIYNVYTYSIGIAWLIPGKKANLKSLLNPTCISLLIGLLSGLLQLPVPQVIGSALEKASACMGPIAMILTGFVVGGFKPLNLIGDWRIYVMTALRLLIIPCITGLLISLISADRSLLISALVVTAMPLGLNTIVIPAAYGGDTKLGAGFALVSSVLAIITIPFVFMLFL